jgi:hypothetical protein
VTNSGSSSAAVFNFTVPQGLTGTTGPAGPKNFISNAFTGQTTVTLTHNLSSYGILVACYAGTPTSPGDSLTPWDVVPTTQNMATVTFLSATTGFCVVNANGGANAAGGFGAVQTYGTNGVLSASLVNTIAGTNPIPAAASGNSGWVILITDGASGTDCTTGGGSTLVWCRSSGSAWAAIGGGGGGSFAPTGTGLATVSSGSAGTTIAETSGNYLLTFTAGTPSATAAGTAATANTAAACSGNNWSQGWTTGSNNCAQVGFSNLSGSASNAQIPVPTTSALGGIEAASGATSNSFVTYVDTSGVQHVAQPSFSNLSGTATNGQLANSATTVNGTTCTLGSTCTVSGGENTQTTSYTLAASDLGKLVVMNCSSACSVTLYGSPTNGYFGAIESIGSTVATVSLNSKTFNASASVPVLLSNRVLTFWSDGTNYFGEAILVAGTGMTFTAAANGLTVGIANNGVANAQLAVVQTRRTCTIMNDNQSATALTAGQVSGSCVIPAAATIVEVDVAGGTGTVGTTAAARTYAGTGSIQIGKYGASSSTGLLSAALATVSGHACALTSTSGTCLFNNGMTSSSSVTVSTTSLTAGDEIYVSAFTADTSQTWYEIAVIYTIN